MDKFLNQIIHANCLEILPQIPSNSIDMVLCDPPYMISSTVKIRRQRNPMKFDKNSSLAISLRERKQLRKIESKDYKYKGKDISFEFGDWDIFPSLKDYLKFSKQWFTECIRVLKKGGHIISFWDKHKLTYIVKWAEKLDVKSRQCLFLIKTNPVPCARKVNFMSGVEMAYWGTKETTQRKFATFNYQLGQHADYFRHCIVGHTTKEDGERVHPTQKPIAMMKWIISYLSNPNDIILDPFAGSGTTLAAAKSLGRKYIGIEKEEKYVNACKKRFAQQFLDLPIKIQKPQLEKELF